jgi:hypothetical protein
MYYYNKWGGLMVRVFATIPKVKGSNLMSDGVWSIMVCWQNIFLSNF